jgi:hypothetical protein
VSAPDFWRDEVTGRLNRPVTRFLNREQLSTADIRLLAMYIQQWIDSPAWDHADEEGKLALADLRLKAHQIVTREGLDRWVKQALNLGIDPF